MIEVPVSSEIMGLLNFLAMDLILLPYIMHVSGRLAGFANCETLKRGNPLKLVVFDPPVIGGGIVMARSTGRTLLITARLSVVLAVAVCNFGLEGRSRVRQVEREAAVRLPGALMEPFEDIYSATERRMRCSGSLEQDMFFFGAVLDDRCYLNSDVHVYIRGLSYNLQPINASAKSCVPRARCETNSTVYRCEHADLICGGLELSSGCTYADNILEASCAAVVYSEDSDYAWVCAQGWLAPNHMKQQVSCRRITARRKDIESWVDHLWISTFDPLTAIFASAYGKEQREVVLVPEGDLLVTVVRVWWFVSTIWVILVAGLQTMYWLQCHRKHLQLFAHDERSLTRLLRNEMKVELSSDENIGYGTIIIGDECMAVNINEISGEPNSARDVSS